MSTTTPKPMFDPFLVTAGTTTPYTTPASTKCIIKHLSAHNTTTTPVKLTVYLVENGGSAGASNQIFSKLIAGEDTAIIFGAINATLEAGATVQVVADTASAISLHGGCNEIV
jgi:hypothetical protein